MFSFTNKNRNGSLTAIVPHSSGVSIASVQMTPKNLPILDLCDFVSWDSVGEGKNILQSKVRQFGLAKSNCTTTMELGEYSVLSVEAPDVPANELRAAVRWQIKDLIDYHIDDAVLDVFDAPASGADGRQRNLYVAVSKMSTVKERVKVLQDVDANVTTIDIPELVLRNITACLPEDDTGVAFVYLSKHRGLIILSRQSTLYLARGLNVGYEDILSEPGLVPSDTNTLVAPGYDQLVLEVQRSLDYYDRYFKQPAIAGVVLAPLDQDSSGLLDYLEQQIGIRSRMLDLNDLFQTTTSIDTKIQANCFLAIGAAMRQTKATL